MSDALSLLRNFVKNRKEFFEEDDKIVFGDVAYPKNVKTNFLIYGTGKDDRPKDYYTLECLVYLVKNRDIQHPLYVKNAGTRNISVVLRPDRRELLSYLSGELEVCASVDKNAPFEIAMQHPQPYVKSSGAAGSQAQGSSNLTSSSATSSSASKRPLPSSRDDLFDSKDEHAPKVPKTSYIDISGALSQQTNESDADLLAGSSAAAGSSQQAAKEQFIDRISKKFDESAAQSTRPITENITQLSDELTKEKIASLKAKKKAQQRKQVASGAEIDDDILNLPSQSANILMSSSSKSSNLTNRITSGDGENNRGSGGDYTGSSMIVSGIDAHGADDSDAIMREIVQRERTCRTRFTILQSSGRQFDKDINAFLTAIKIKEEGSFENGVMSQTIGGGLSQPGGAGTQRPLNTLNGSSNVGALSQSQQMQAQQKARLGYNRFDQERYAAKDETGGFSIDTKLTYQANPGAISLTSSNPSSAVDASQSSGKMPSSQSFQSSQLSKPNAPASIGSGSTQPGGARPGYSQPSNAIQQSPPKKITGKPIIIIPAARTSLITMANCVDILQDLKYVSSEDKRKSMSSQDAYKDAQIVIHKREGRRDISFKVIDNPTKLAPDDWHRVVACFVQGQQWQFRDWKLGDGNPSEIFNRIKGFHLKISGMPSDPNISKWSVTVVELDHNKRHLDKARLLALWDELDKYMMKNKPYLCG